MKAELLSTARDGEGLLEYLKRSPVSEHLGGKTFLDGDGGQVDNVLSPHMEVIMKPSKLWKKERVGLKQFLGTTKTRFLEVNVRDPDNYQKLHLRIAFVWNNREKKRESRNERVKSGPDG